MIFLQSQTSKKQEKGIVRLLEISRLVVRRVINTSCVLYKVQCQVRKMGVCVAHDVVWVECSRSLCPHRKSRSLWSDNGTKRVGGRCQSADEIDVQQRSHCAQAYFKKGVQETLNGGQSSVERV